MLRRIFAFMAAAALTVCLAGCSDYVMTEEDLAIYKSIQGCWVEIGRASCRERV